MTTAVRFLISRHLKRQTFLRWERGARETTVDLIPAGTPLSATFFRQLLRDAYEAEDLEPFTRWIQPPRFYLRTVVPRLSPT